MPLAARIQIRKLCLDARSKILTQKFRKHGIQKVTLVDNYTITKPLTPTQKKQIGNAFINPVLSEFSWRDLIPPKFHFVTEISFQPGVTDNLGQTARLTIEDLLGKKFNLPTENVFSSKRYFWTGKNLTPAKIKKITTELFNPLIERSQTISSSEYKKKGLPTTPPQVTLTPPQNIPVDLEIPDPELGKLGKLGIQNPDGSRRGPLALTLLELKVIRNHFRRQKRKVTEIELETLAQTWSEHCKHKIFSSPLDEIKEGLYARFIKKTTAKIRQQKGARDFCASVFHDNSGAIIFDEKYLLTDKVETHNSPSALDPFGGALTGLVGVNRDCLGFGRAAKPIANRYGFCVGKLQTKQKLFRQQQRKNPVLSPQKILAGISAGIRSGGNESGIPTTHGFLFFHPRYRGKPLVFAGTVGLIPRKIAQKYGHEKKARPGDQIVMLGGRVGADGLHGATFSSESLNAESPATAVQIGDPFTQKKLSDALIREAKNFFNSITDCGAGGLSSAVAEMAQEAGGCQVFLERVPQKYPNLSPTEIWLAESQERMVLAVPPQKLPAFLKLMRTREVEATVIGKFTRPKKCEVFFKKTKVLNLSMDFLHNGWPRLTQTSRKPPTRQNKSQPAPIGKNLAQEILQLIRSPNLASHAFLTRQFDYEVQGSSVLKPLQNQVDSPVSVIKPLPASPRGVVITSQIFPRRTEVDPYATAVATVDAVVASVTAVGGDPNYLALLDNFCWCSSQNPERLWQLKEAARGLAHAAEKFGTPLISGKDSMFNDFHGFTAKNQQIQISALPTLLISGLGVMTDINNCLSLEPKFRGDELWLLGQTQKELGASEYSELKKNPADRLPQIDLKIAPENYQQFFQATQRQLIASSLPVLSGGLTLAFTKKILASSLGLTIDLAKIPTKGRLSPAEILFAETGSRILFTLNPRNSAAIKKLLGSSARQIGTVTKQPNLSLNFAQKQILNLSSSKLQKAYAKPFANF